MLCACSESFTDARDGQSYGIVQIGSRTWMSENLNFDMDGAEVGTGDAGNGAGGVVASFCPEGDARKCGEYGRLYTWAAAQKACPEGWRLPSREDFVALVEAAGGADGSLGQNSAGGVLKAKSGWFKKGNGTDGVGFRALPAGYMAAPESADGKPRPGKFDGIGGYAYFWSASPDPQESAFAQYLFLDFSSKTAQIASFDMNSARSVRCIATQPKIY